MRRVHGAAAKPAPDTGEPVDRGEPPVLHHGLCDRRPRGCGHPRARRLGGQTGAIDAGRPAEYWLLEHGFERGIYKRQEDVFRGVEVGEAPAGLLPFPLATWLSRDKPGLVVIPLAEPSLAFPLGVATRSDDVALTEAMDHTITRLLATGAIEEILRRYKAVP